jgi:hypothetical protein
MRTPGSESDKPGCVSLALVPGGVRLCSDEECTKRAKARGRGLRSSTSQLNLSRFRHRIHSLDPPTPSATS